jgi:hypothetical protein
MANYNLTEDHKRILRQRAFSVTATNVGWVFMDWKGDDWPKLELIDLQVLAEDDFLSLRVTAYAKSGNPSTVQCTLREKAFEAVKTDFAPPEPSIPTQFNIGAIIHAMSGGNVQAIGIAKDTEVSQIVNDPTLLHSQVEALTTSLLDEVKYVLIGNDLIGYTQAVQGFKEELLAEKPDPSLLKRFTGTLALLGDVEGTIGLMVRTWPYLYPLLLIAAEKLA